MAAESVQLLGDLVDLVESGAVHAVVERTYPLRQAPDAVRHVATGHSTCKVVVTL